jgi:hypothetical protein
MVNKTLQNGGIEFREVKFKFKFSAEVRPNLSEQVTREPVAVPLIR